MSVITIFFNDSIDQLHSHILHSAFSPFTFCIFTFDHFAGLANIILVYILNRSQQHGKHTLQTNCVQIKYGKITHFFYPEGSSHSLAVNSWNIKNSINVSLAKPLRDPCGIRTNHKITQQKAPTCFLLS